jgi:hypothetical protein
MNLKLATLEYVALKQSMGMRFETEAALLRSFVKEMGDAVAVATVTSKDVLRYLNGRKAGTRDLVLASETRRTQRLLGVRHPPRLYGSLSGSRSSRQRAGSLRPIYLLTGGVEEAVGRSHQLSEEVAETGASYVAGHAATDLRSGSSHK